MKNINVKITVDDDQPFYPARDFKCPVDAVKYAIDFLGLTGSFKIKIEVIQ